MIKTNLPTLVTLNNCDELIEFVCNELADYPGDIVEFQGETLEVTKTDLSCEEIGVIKEDILVSTSTGGFFYLHAIKSPLSFDDKFTSVVVPDYVQDELIAPLQAEW